MAYTTPSTVTSSDVLTAALWNTQIRDNFESMPRGVMARAAKTDNQSTIGPSPTDVTSLSVTWTATASRLYLITVQANVEVAGAGIAFVLITDPSNLTTAQTGITIAAGGQSRCHLQFYLTGSSGSQTRKVRAYTSNAGSTMSVNGLISPAQLLVQDIGLA